MWENYYDIVVKNELFEQLSEKEIHEILMQMEHKVQLFEKEETILQIGSKPKYFGIVLSGEARIVRYSLHGDLFLLSELEEADMFAESFVFAKQPMFPLEVKASTSCIILFLAPNENGQLPNLLYQRMLKILAQKNVALSEQMDTISQRSSRARILSYLEKEARKAGTSQITIPFNREELADFLCINRSNLSRELSSLQNEGILTYHKNKFTLY